MKLIVIVVMILAITTCVNADILSVNSGGDSNVVVTPGGAIEDFFFGITPTTTGVSGGGGGGRGASTVTFNMTVRPQVETIFADNLLPIQIIFENNYQEDKNVILTYYLRNGNVTTPKKNETAKNLPMGIFAINRTIEIPANTSIGDWDLVVEYKSMIRQFEVKTPISIVPGIWPVVREFLMWVIIITAGMWFFFIYRPRKKREEYEQSRYGY